MKSVPRKTSGRSSGASSLAAKYRLVPSKNFLRDLKKLPPEIRPVVEGRLKEIIQDPFSGPHAKKLSGVGLGEYRLRAGDYRVRYDVRGTEVTLYSVRHRRDAYKQR